jgi:RNase P/RNase MRP subunit POP5
LFSELPTASSSFDSFQLKQMIDAALSTSYGQHGFATPVDVVHFDRATRVFILRAPSASFARVNAAMTLYGAARFRSLAPDSSSLTGYVKYMSQC